jgi:LacI family transcriptional regulator
MGEESGPRVPVSRGRPTMKDVAAHAGVALKTVSRVVNNEPGVADEMANRVRSSIAELGFRRNDSARLLRTGQASTIGLIMEDIGDPFYSALSRAAEDVAHRHGALLLIGSSDEEPARERQMTLSFCARRVDGLIIVPAGTDHRYLLPEIEAGIAAVFLDRPAGLIDADVVLSDNEGGAYTGVSHLIRHGHRAIGFIGDSADIYTAGLRYRGYLEAMRSAGLRVDESWVVLAPPEASGIARALARMITGPTPVTALFCGNNRSTVLVLRELARMGRRPGVHGREGAGAAGTLALAGFDDFELADMIAPPVTVIAQDPGEMGRVAAELLFRRLAGERGPAQRVMLSTHLIVRGSGEVPPSAVTSALDRGGQRPDLVGSVVAVPDAELGARCGAESRVVEALAGLGVEQLAVRLRNPDLRAAPVAVV